MPHWWLIILYLIHIVFFFSKMINFYCFGKAKSVKLSSLSEYNDMRYGISPEQRLKSNCFSVKIYHVSCMYKQLNSISNPSDFLIDSFVKIIKYIIRCLQKLSCKYEVLLIFYEFNFILSLMLWKWMKIISSTILSSFINYQSLIL